jgi:mycothiol system anti-sigma-R factor
MMNCSEMEEIISAYADNELPQDEKEKVQNHLDSCGKCRGMLKFEMAAKSAVRSMQITKAPSRLRQSIMAEISKDAEPSTEKVIKTPFLSRIFKQNVAFATAAIILLFIGVFIAVTHLFVNGKMSPFIGTVYAYHIDNDTSANITGASEDIEKALSKILLRDIPLPDLADMDLALCGASNHSDVEGRHCAAVRYKGKDGKEISHFIICCMKVPIDNLPQVKDRPEYRCASKNGLNIIFWRCNATQTTRCIAAECPLEELVQVTDGFIAKSAAHFKEAHSKAN